MSEYNLLSVGADAKTVKGEKKGYLTGILYLAPTDVSGYNVCPWSTAGCRAACLFTAGHGMMGAVQRARIRKTRFFKEEEASFLKYLADDIDKLKRIAKKRKMTPCVRLNGTSDIMWEKIFPISSHEIQFYDYTKNGVRYCSFLEKDKFPSNYHLTYSCSGEWANDKSFEKNKTLDLGGTIAIVFDTKKGQPLPIKYQNYPVIDGDLSDLRFLDPKGVIVGLRAKGKAIKDTTGFVVKV